MDEHFYGYLGMGFTFMILLGGITAYSITIQQRNKTKQLQFASDEHYAKLVESSMDLQRQVVEGQDKLLGELEEIRGRLTSVEKLLREVE
jgi:hypothetical protein